MSNLLHWLFAPLTTIKRYLTSSARLSIFLFCCFRVNYIQFVAMISASFQSDPHISAHTYTLNSTQCFAPLLFTGGRQQQQQQQQQHHHFHPLSSGSSVQVQHSQLLSSSLLNNLNLLVSSQFENNNNNCDSHQEGNGSSSDILDCLWKN